MIDDATVNNVILQERRDLKIIGLSSPIEDAIE